jgi:hypothetical protein
MKSQIILKCVDVDQRTYDNNYLLANGTVNQNYTNVYYGYCNYYRSQIIFKNISLKNAIPNYKDKDKFHIKLIKILGQREYNTNCINEANDSQTILTSNLYIRGLPFLGNTSERLLNTIRLPNFSNKFICNFQARTTISLRQKYTFSTFGTTGTGSASSMELVKFINTNISQNTIQYFRLTTITNDAFNIAGGYALSPIIENVILQFGTWSTSTSGASADLSQVTIVSSQADAIFTSTTTNINVNCYFEFLPTTNLNYNFVPPEDTYNNELTFHKPPNDNVDITLELRDLLNNSLQPVAVTTGIYPSYTYHLEIE